MAKHAVTAPPPRKPPGEASRPGHVDLPVTATQKIDFNARSGWSGADEAGLTERAQKQLPREIDSRFKALAKKRDAESLTPSEYQELQTLTDEVERFEVQRLEALAQLARLRGLSLKALIKALDVQPPSNV